MTKLRWVLLIVGGIGMAVAAIAGGMVARPACGRWAG